jgi:SAM-dependent methyltransferase
MASADAVRELFNAKAPGWRRKYDADGPLARRIAEFDTRLTRRVAAPADVLVLGCGTGNLAFHLSGRGYRLHACDIAERMLEEARASYPAAPIDWVQLDSDWTRLPFGDGSMDAAVASSVFAYLEDAHHVATEIARVLKPGGLLLFTVPNPDAGVRRVESVLRPVAGAARGVSFPESLHRVHRYLQYLRLSKNRFEMSGWRSVLSQAGLKPAQEGLLDGGAFGMLATSPLLLLAFEKPSAP